MADNKILGDGVARLIDVISENNEIYLEKLTEQFEEYENSLKFIKIMKEKKYYLMLLTPFRVFLKKHNGLLNGQMIKILILLL